MENDLQESINQFRLEIFFFRVLGCYFVVIVGVFLYGFILRSVFLVVLFLGFFLVFGAFLGGFFSIFFPCLLQKMGSCSLLLTKSFQDGAGCKNPADTSWEKHLLETPAHTHCWD